MSGPDDRGRATDARPAGRRRVVGYFEGLAAATLWGSSGIFAVHLFRMGVPPESVALLRPAVGVVFLALWLVGTHRSDLRTDRRGVLILGVGGGAAIGLFQLAYQLSTDAVGVPTTVALLYVAPAVVVVGAGPLLHEPPSATRVALTALTLLGVWLTVLGAESVGTIPGSGGIHWGLIAGVSYGAYTLFGRLAAPRFGAATTVLYSTLGASVMLAVAVPASFGRVVLPASAGAWALLLLFGLLTIALAHFLFFDALSRVEASRVSIATAVEPAVAAVLATTLLSQGLAPLGWLGVALVAGGVAGAGITADRPAHSNASRREHPPRRGNGA